MCVNLQVLQNVENKIFMKQQDSLQQEELMKLENEIESLSVKCNILEQERQDAVNELQSTQLMSSDQIEKLCTLERKQDFLEAENEETRAKLMLSQKEYNGLSLHYQELQKKKDDIEAANKELLNKVSEMEISISKFETEIIFQQKTENGMLDEKIKAMTAEIEKLKEEKDNLEEKINSQTNDHCSDVRVIRDAYQIEKENLDKQIVSLKEKLLDITDMNEKLLLEKQHLDEKLAKIKELDYDGVISQLKLELKQNKALLRDAQSDKNSGFKSEKLIKQLKNQLEETENEKLTLTRQKKNLEIDILDLQEKIDEQMEERKTLDNKFEIVTRENSLLNNQLKDNEEELENILARYKTSISTLTAHQTSLQNQAVIIAELENENINLTDKLEVLQKKIIENEKQFADAICDNKHEIELKDLKQKLEHEFNLKQKYEIQLEKLNEKIEESGKEQDSIRRVNQHQEDINKKLTIQVKDLREDIVTMQIREMDIIEKKNILEKKLEIAEAETITVRSQLDLANRRIEDLQLALNCDTESESSSLPYSDGYQDDLDLFLMNHRKKMAEQKEEERRIRESLLKETKIESEC